MLGAKKGKRKTQNTEWLRNTLYVKKKNEWVVSSDDSFEMELNKEAMTKHSSEVKRRKTCLK